MEPPPSFPHDSAVATTIATNTPTSVDETNNKPQHKRVYQACIPCRRRKVKCNLGSVDSPQDPPCQRCRRESKDCYFSATRRKRKTDDGLPEGGDDYVVRNGRKRLHSEASPTPPRPLASAGSENSRPYSYLDNAAAPPPLTPGGSIGRSQPLRRPDQSVNGSENAQEDPNGRWENFEAQKVMSREMYGPHDALDLLYKAATDSPGHKLARSFSNSQQPPTTRNGSIPTTYKPSNDSRATAGVSYHSNMRPTDLRNATLDPALSAEDRRYSDTSRDPGYNEALKAWARFRFVRAGWFTPSEAIAYIEYYYQYLSPLTPISPPTFRDPGTHITLLTEEPILTVTLLTIATRYMKLSGAGGHCRSHAIHEQLWTYLRGMIERCLWGQEGIGGGFCGSGGTEIHDAQGSSTAPWRGLRKGSLRTLGTVESLMILTEWHPRALHFPPAEATDELMLPDYNVPDASSSEDGDQRLPGGVGGRRIESWLEPAWRSDRMCWMLLSNAMGLSYELGVFDKIEEMMATGGDMARPEYEDEAYRLRASRVKKLLLIYVTQLAGRLGWTNMVPEDLRSSEPAFEHRRRKASNDFNSPGTNTTTSNTFNYIPDLELDDQIIHCWSSITTVMRIGNERLFKSRKHTTMIIQNGKYIDLLKDFQPMLSTWVNDFKRFTLPPYQRHILAIEYEYVRIYLNSLSLQAVVERCTNSAGISGPLQGHQPVNMAALSPETQSYYGKLPLAKLGGYGEADSAYVKEVVDGSRSLLRTVVDGLLPNGYLKHAPVRTYFRIMSGAMFLLKTFALGAPKNEIEISIGLMDRTVDALRNCVVDDVHLGIRFAELLETLTTRLRNRFIHSASQVQPPTTSGTQSPVAPNGNQGPQQVNATGNRDARANWNATLGVPTFDQLTNQSDLNAPIAATPFDDTHGQPLYPKSSTPLPNPYAVPNIYPNGGNGGADMGDGYGVERNEAEDFWYLPTGAAFFQNNDQPITQTAEGVNVGGWDLLDLMAMDPGCFPLGPDSSF